MGLKSPVFISLPDEMKELVDKFMVVFWLIFSNLTSVQTKLR